MWHKLNNGKTFDEVKEIYYDACQLNVMSGLEIDVQSPRKVTCVKNYALNCWETVKVIVLQHNTEICICANVVKTEKNYCMAQG